MQFVASIVKLSLVTFSSIPPGGKNHEMGTHHPSVGIYVGALARYGNASEVIMPMVVHGSVCSGDHLAFVQESKKQKKRRYGLRLSDIDINNTRWQTVK